LTGKEGGADPRRPFVFLDHVLVPVSDLEEAAERFRDEYGLQVLPGGRHPWGTANMIIPLGSNYIELIAVVDATRAADSPRYRRIAEAARAGKPFATWAARTDDLNRLRKTLRARGWKLEPALDGSRVRPDGILLEWRSQELVPNAAPSVLPFLIEWQVPDGMHPAEAPVRHPSGAGDIAFARFEAPDPDAARAELEALVGGNLAFSVEGGPEPALVEVQLEAPAGRISIR
jgi:hypothetical protein